MTTPIFTLSNVVRSQAREEMMSLLENDRWVAARELALLYAVSLGVLLLLDAVWLGWIAKGFYQNQLGSLLSASVSWLPAILFYFLYAAGLTIFVTLPAIDRDDSLLRIALLSALFGLVAYGAYDLTNLATLREFPVFLAFVDMTWGAFVSSAMGTLSIVAYRLWVTR
jgi:uncharacterized membrane protein